MCSAPSPRPPVHAPPMQPARAARPGARALLETLLEEGIDLVFGYPGGAIMPVYDALLEFRGRLRHVLVRHEQGAIHAAQGYARASGRVGVCIATSGPGATNLLTGIADALADSTPVVCLTGQVNSALLGTDAFQEVDMLALCAPITKWSARVEHAEDIVPTLRRACAIARDGRPGPVVVDLTKDAQSSLTTMAPRSDARVSRSSTRPKARTSDLEAAQRLLDAAERPLLVIGQGISLSNAEAALLAFAECTRIPVACTLLGLSSFPTSHPLFVGMVGMHGRVGANMNTNACDVLLAIGMRFDDRVTGDTARYARQAKVIHVDIDPAELGRRVATTLQIHADAKSFLEGALARVTPRDHTRWRSTFLEYDAIELERVGRNDLDTSRGRLGMAEVIRALSEHAGTGALWVSDVGQHQMMVARYADFGIPRGHITSGGLGTMGFAIPAAIGAKLAVPDRTVLAVVGDGGAQMTIQELGVAAQEAVAIKVVVLDNEALGMVRQWQTLFYGDRRSQTGLVSPSFIGLARAFGVAAQHVQRREDLGGAIATMLAHPGPYLLHVTVRSDDDVFPMIPPGAGVSDLRMEP